MLPIIRGVGRPSPRLYKGGPLTKLQSKGSKMPAHQKNSDRVKISSGGAYESIFGYSRAVRAGADIHVSGTCAPVGHEKSSAYEQARAALSIIEKALADAGASSADVVRTVVYLRDINDAEEVAKAHLETFDTIRPASTLVQVTSMLRPWQKVEIEAYAKVSQD